MKWSIRPHRRPIRRRRFLPNSSPLAMEVESLEARLVLSAAFDVTDLTALRQRPEFADIDGALADGTKIGIVVIDSGVLGAHADLQVNFVAFFDAVATDANADGTLTQADSQSPSGAFDPHGHGTHVAGIAASSNSNIGVATSAGLIGIRGLLGPGESLPRHDPLLSSLQWVEENHRLYNIKVVNLSIQDGTNTNGIPNPTDFARQVEVLESLGITVVTASGNSYADYMTLGASVPAALSSLSVANTWEDNGAGDQLPALSAGPQPQYVAIDAAPTADQLAASSQRSTLGNQVAAPGSSIFSTWNDGGYNTISGTSMASPFVAGMVALIQDAAFTFGGRYLSVEEVISIVRSSAENILDAQNSNTLRARLESSGSGSGLGPLEDLLESGQNYRRVNVLNAVLATQALVSQSPGAANGDVNNTRGSAIGFPPVDGTQEFAIAGNIGRDGSLLIGPNDVDLFRIVVESPGQLRVKTEPLPGGQNFDAYLRIFNEAGDEMASQNDAAGGSLYPDLTTGILPPGVYFVGLSSFANTGYNPNDPNSASGGAGMGDYQFTVSLANPDPTGVVQGAIEVDLTSPNASNSNSDLLSRGIYTGNRFLNQEIGDDSIAGSLGGVLAEIPGSFQIGAGDVDFFRVVAPDSGKLFVEIDSTSYGSAGIDSFLRIFTFDGSGNLVSVASNDNASANTTDSYLEIDVAIGQTYFIAVATAGNQTFDPQNPFGRVSSTNDTGRYDLFLSFFNGDEDGTALGAVNFAAANSLSDTPNDNTLQGTIGSDSGTPLSGAQGGFKDVDFFVFEATQNGLLDVSLAGAPGGAFVGAVGIWELDPAGTNIVRLAGTTGTQSRLQREVAAGQRIWISVTGLGNHGFHWAAPGSGSGGATGDYSLSIQELPASELTTRTNNSIAQHTPTPIHLGETVTAAIGLDGQTIVGGSDVDLYSYTPTVSQIAVIRTFAGQENSADTFLRVFDATGTELAANNDAHGGTNGSEITVVLHAGQTYYIGVNGNSLNARDYDALTGADASAGSSGSYSLRITELPPPIYATGADAGGGPHVRVFDARSGQELASVFPYSVSFTGGVRVAVGDVTGDGIDDVVTAAGPGGGPHVRVLDGATWKFREEPHYNFFAFQPQMLAGLNVAVGDVNNDGYEDIIVAPDAGSSPAVRAFSGKDGTILHSFFAYQLGVNGGVRVASGDVNGDGFDDIITVPGPGFLSHVRVFAGQSPHSGIAADLRQTSGLRIGSFFAYPGFYGGAYVAAGDINADGLADVILGAGAGGGPHVLVFNASNTGPSVLQDFMAYGLGFRGGVRVGASDFGLDGHAEVVTGAGPGGGPHVRLFDGKTPSKNVANNFPYGRFSGGVFVAGGGNSSFLEHGQRLAVSSDEGFQTGTGLMLDDLAPIREAALARFVQAGRSAAEIEHLRTVTFSLSDLPGHQLGLAVNGTIILDLNAAGVGWYLDPTPLRDEEFARAADGTLRAVDVRAAGVDLLSVILHEYAHHLGGEDHPAELHPDHLLADAIAPGQRRVPARDALDAAFAGLDLFADLLPEE